MSIFLQVKVRKQFELVMVVLCRERRSHETDIMRTTLTVVQPHFYACQYACASTTSRHIVFQQTRPVDGQVSPRPGLILYLVYLNVHWFTFILQRWLGRSVMSDEVLITRR